MSGASVWVSYWVTEEGRVGVDERASEEGREGVDERASEEGRVGVDERSSEEGRVGVDERASEEGRAGRSEWVNDWVSERVVGTPFGCQFSLSGVVYQPLKNSDTLSVGPLGSVDARHRTQRANGEPG